MEQQKVYTVIGLMSGTSTDGVDAALLRTDGLGFSEALDFITVPYDQCLRMKIMEQFGKQQRDDQVAIVEQEITLKHVEAVEQLIAKSGVDHVDLIGFHGQTISHDPDQKRTLQIGDADLLASRTGIDVVNDFRTADVNAGGQGAPLIPLYHQSLAAQKNIKKPCAFLNIGGVSNVTWVGQSETDILAFDCGPGNALIDDVMQTEFSLPYDENGKHAEIGCVDEDVINQLMGHPYFQKQPPKSLDRNAWSLGVLSHLTSQDKVTTLTAFTIEAIVNAQSFMPKKPQEWYICGGGRHNQAIVDGLKAKLSGDVYSIDKLSIDGDALEAEGFGYLAVRSINGLPLSLPSTTGVPKPQTGGKHRKVA